MKKITRRDFIKYGLGTAAALSVGNAVDLARYTRRAVAAGIEPFSAVMNLVSPLYSQPAMLKTGAPLAIKMKPGANLIAASLLDEKNKEHKLAPEKDGDGWKAAIPAQIGPGLYHLQATTAGGPLPPISETQPRAVAIFDTFKENYDFVWISDIHFGEHDGTLPDTVITPEMAQYYKMRAKALQTADKLNPEYIVIGGDLTLYPRNYHLGFPEVYGFLLNYLRKPLHILPGNHDSYHLKVKELGGQFVDALTYWNKYFGEKRYHSFDYGQTHIVCADTSDYPEKFLNWGSPDAMSTGALLSASFSQEQYQWMKADLEAATARGATNIICAHIPLHNYIGGKKLGLPAQKIPGATEKEVFDALIANGVEHAYIGHLHLNDEKVIAGGKIKEHMIRNIGGDFLESESAGIALIRVRNNKIDGHEIIELTA